MSSKDRHMKKTFVLSTIFIFLFILTAFAETTIKAEVDKISLTTDETLTYKIIITSTEKQVPLPQLPKFEGFNSISQAQSSTISFVKSEIKTIIVYAYILAPTDIGKFKIKPSTIKFKDKTYSSDAFEIGVSRGKIKPKKPQTLPGRKLPLPKGFQPESEEPQITL